MNEERLVYFVQNEQGLYYAHRAKWAYSACWTNRLSKARLLTTIGVAKSTCTWMANVFPDKPIPNLIEYNLHPSKGKVIDVAAHTQASITKKKVLNEKRDLERRANEIKRLEQVKEIATEELARLVDS